MGQTTPIQAQVQTPSKTMGDIDPHRGQRTSTPEHPEECLRVAVALSPVAVLLIERSGTILLANARAEELFGWMRGELAGQAVEQLVPERYRAGSTGVGPFSGSRTNTEGAGQDVRALRKDGTEFPIEIALEAVETEAGTCVLAAIMDLSERRRVEELLRRSTAELSRASAELEQFAYAASHDLQEPLRMISSYLQILEKHLGVSLDERGREFIAFASDGVQHLGRLIEGLLAYSRAGTSSMQLRRFPAGEAVERALHELAGAVKDSQAEVRWRDLPEIEADFPLVVQVFQHVLSNAVRFRSRERPRIEISAEDRGSERLFHVRDNGIGIEERFAERIFGVFQRLHPRDKYPGAGIGLAICRRIVERHGGTMRLESGVDGSTFVFSLPARAQGDRR